jgi:hypothetical protein
VTESFVCFMASPFPLLDEYRLKQIVMQAERDKPRTRSRPLCRIT